MVRLPRARLEQAALALVITLPLASLGIVIPKLTGRWAAIGATPSAAATASPTAPPAAVLLQDELARDLDGVVILVNDHDFGTAVVIDAQGDLLTAASLVDGSPSLRLVDNTGGSHAVRLVGVDRALGVAEIRADNGGAPIPLGDPSRVRKGDPVVLLASPKIATLPNAAPAVITQQTPALLSLHLDDLPGNIGGPVVGPGGKVLALFVGRGRAVPITLIEPDVASWHGLTGSVLPLAPLPSNLVLRASDETTAPSSGPAGGPTLQSIAPSRASAAQDTLVTLQGSGFNNGPLLRVQFVPIASPSGGFDGLVPTLVNASTMTVRVPAGQAIQDYVVQLTNGDGSAVSSRTGFTVTP